MAFFNIEAIEPFALFDGVHLRVISGERLMMSFVEFEPHGVVPEHRHPHEQMGMVVEGAFELAIDGDVRTVRRGDAYHIPSNVLHRARAIGERAVALDLFSPPREEYVERARKRNDG